MIIYLIGNLFVISISLAKEIAPGLGYSSISQQLAPSNCFNTIPEPSVQERKDNQTDRGLSYEELATALNFSGSESGHYHMFDQSSYA